MRELAQIVADIQAASGVDFRPGSAKAVSGGCINSAWRIESARGWIFVKTNRADALEMFEAEEEGLRELRSAEALRVPEPLLTGRTAGNAWIAMEWIEPGRPKRATARELGEGLARQHRRVAKRFGWHRDNTIGSTPQINGWSDNWASFFAERRLRYQFDLAETRGCPAPLVACGRRLTENASLFFADYSPEPSLLHGDLWGGNWAADTEGRPFLYDPAVYFGDREADIAMTELFGGFDSDFYAAYNDAWALDRGYEARRRLYNLYHVLNHFNLFGSSYLGQADAMTRRLLAECGG